MWCKVKEYDETMKSLKIPKHIKFSGIAFPYVYLLVSLYAFIPFYKIGSLYVGALYPVHMQV